MRKKTAAALPEAWADEPLSLICERLTDGSHFSPKSQTRGLPIANVKDLRPGFVDIESCTKIRAEDFESLVRNGCDVREHDVLLSKDGTIGRVVAYRQIDALVALSSIAILRPKRGLDSAFLGHALQSADLTRQYAVLAGGSALRRLVLRDINRITVSVPPLPEQIGVAAVLDTVDEAIAKTEAVIAKLQQVRTGVLHDLLTRGLDAHGQLRDAIAHPEQFQSSSLGRIPKEWDVVPLARSIGTIFDYRGRTPLKINMEWGGGEIPALSAMNVEMGRINFEKETNFGSPALYDRWMTQGHTEQGDVLITMEAPLGNIAQIPDGNRYILSQRVVLLRPKPAMLAKNYLAVQMSGTRFQRELVRYSSGSTAVGIQRAKLERIEIAVPKRADEQEAIALSIDTADNEIAAIERELEKLRHLKSGLMADLLTGRVRVPETIGTAP